MLSRRQRHEAVHRMAMGQRNPDRFFDRLKKPATSQEMLYAVILIAIVSYVGIRLEAAFHPDGKPAAIIRAATSHAGKWDASTMARHIAARAGCREAQAVGLGHARRGQPGYWPQWDGDDDGISCERW